MLNCITGRPGEGKSAYSVRFILVEELLKGRRPIYTNIQLNLDELESYCESLGAKVDMTRVHYLEENQIQDFWKHTEASAVVVLDEVAEFFNAQEWKTIGKEVGSYARLHRHAGHDTYLVVQDIGHIYKQFRDLVQFHFKVRNLYTRKLLGIFRFKMFQIGKYDLGSDGPPVLEESKLFRYNNEIFAIYDTHQVYEGTAVDGIAEVSDYQETEMQATSKRTAGQIFGWLGGKFFAICVILFLVVVVVVMASLPSCFSRHAAPMTHTKKKTIKERVEERKEDEKAEPIIDHAGVGPDLDTVTGAGENSRPRTTVRVGRYDQDNKRKP